MNNKLEQHQSSTPSHWREAAEFRQANKAWLRHSQHIAMMMLNKMEEQHVTQQALSERMGCTQQFVAKILRGQENLSIETISKIEDALFLQILPKSSRLNKINSGSHV
jgi:antitoxin component HigA of HigAB toxin-antitoxin module